MIFEKDRLYHIYNQGNNRNKIFFNRENYQLFLSKIEKHMLPYTDILAWCLMPNHFHLMVLVKEIELTSDNLNAQNSGENKSLKKQSAKKRTLNDSIGILLRSYTRSFNSQRECTGSLFRNHTKANCINSIKDLQPNFWKSKIAVFNMLPEKQYPQICFNYIHYNPVKAGLVDKDIDWEYSSAQDYANLRKDGIINKQRAKMHIDF